MNFLLRGWIGNLETDGSVELPLLSEQESNAFNASSDLEFPRDGSQKSVKGPVFRFQILVLELDELFCPSSLGRLRIQVLI